MTTGIIKNAVDKHVSETAEESFQWSWSCLGHNRIVKDFSQELNLFFEKVTRSFPKLLTRVSLSFIGHFQMEQAFLPRRLKVLHMVFLPRNLVFMLNKQFCWNHPLTSDVLSPVIRSIFQTWIWKRWMVLNKTPFNQTRNPVHSKHWRFISAETFLVRLHSMFF